MIEAKIGAVAVPIPDRAAIGDNHLFRLDSRPRTEDLRPGRIWIGERLFSKQGRCIRSKRECRYPAKHCVRVELLCALAYQHGRDENAPHGIDHVSPDAKSLVRIGRQLDEAVQDGFSLAREWPKPL